MIPLTVASNSPLFKRLEANVNVASGAIDKIAADISQFPNLISAYFYEAIRRNRIDVLKSLVGNFNTHQQTEPGTNILDLEYGGMHLLSVAILHQNMDMVKWMVDSGASINLGDTDTHKTPLHYACEAGNVNIVRMLIEKSTDVNALSESNETPLHHACKSGNVTIVCMLIDKNANVNALNSSDNTPLHYACVLGNEGIVRMLIEKSANVNALDRWNKTPLHYVCDSGNEAIVHMLIEKNTNVNALTKSNWTPLHYACDSGNEDIVRMLIEKNANMNALTQFNETSLQLACKSGNEGIVRILIDKNANVNALNGNNMTPLHYACESGNDGIVRILIEKNVNVNALNKSNWTPLHYACKSGNVVTIQIMTENGATVIDEASDYMSLLRNALESGNDAPLRYFFDHAKSFNLDDSILNGASLLNALERGHYGIASLLIEHGTNFGSIKSQWLGSSSTRKIELFFSNPHLFNQLNRIEKTKLLINSSYTKILDSNLPDHVIGSRLGCIFMLFSLNISSDIKIVYDQQSIGYSKFMFAQARLFLQRKWPCNGQDPELISILRQVFCTVFKHVNFDKMCSKMDESCKLLTGPSGFINNKGVQQWIQRYLKYPWAFREAIKTSPELASSILQHGSFSNRQSNSLQKSLQTS